MKELGKSSRIWGQSCRLELKSDPLGTTECSSSISGQVLKQKFEVGRELDFDQNCSSAMQI